MSQDEFAYEAEVRRYLRQLEKEDFYASLKMQLANFAEAQTLEDQLERITVTRITELEPGEVCRLASLR
jgi:hypothetical protein